MTLRVLVATTVVVLAPVVGILHSDPADAVDDPRLAALSVSAGALSPAFDPAGTSYSVGTAASTTTVSATPTTGGAPKLLFLDGVFVEGLADDVPSAPLALHPGPNVVTVRVIAVDNENVFRDYVVTIVPIPPTVSFVAGDTFLAAGALYQAGLASSHATSAVIDYGDGSGAQSVVPNPDGGIGLAHVFVREGTFVVTVAVTGPGGTAVAQQVVDVFVADPTGSDAILVPPGSSGTAGIGGVTATLIRDGSGVSSAYLVLAALPGDVAGSLGAPSGAFLFDLRVVGAGPGDTLVVTFSYPGDAAPVLFFFDPATRTLRPVVPSRTAPNPFSVDPATHTATIVLDATSAPSVASLSGTVFSVAPGPGAPPAAPVSAQPAFTG